MQALSASAARGFLESQLVVEAGLLRASVNSFPDNVTVWVTSDNLLAYKALEALGSPLAEELWARLGELNATWDGLHEAVLGEPIPCPPRAPVVMVLGEVYSGSRGAWFVVKREVRLGRLIADWRGYADLLAYEALSMLAQGRLEEAKQLYVELLGMWDGWGFRDKAYRGSYEAYKLALAVYLHRSLEAAGAKLPPGSREVMSKCMWILTQLQQLNGGVATHYKVEGGVVVPVGDVNTETTSLAVIAFYAEPVTPRTAPRPQLIETSGYVLVLALVVVAVLARSIVRKRVGRRERIPRAP